ncbi:MAG TPA: hypothetical protein VNO30_32575 [Kofleriaceae bacterium]|nr:hypothetical protein [Kofleriaceae bacterium]
MKLPRFIGLVDLAVIVSLAIAIPILSSPRPMQASDAVKGTDAERFALAHAEAQAIANPTSGAKIAELAERVGEAGFKDWAIETAVGGAERGKGAPDRWRALSAASVAYVDRLDVRPALQYIDMALSVCESSREACPSWEQLRMDFYRQHLAAGIESGIDPRKDPVGFRNAGEKALRPVRLSPARQQP